MVQIADVPNPDGSHFVFGLYQKWVYLAWQIQADTDLGFVIEFAPVDLIHLQVLTDSILRVKNILQPRQQEVMEVVVVLWCMNRKGAGREVEQCKDLPLMKKPWLAAIVKGMTVVVVLIDFYQRGLGWRGSWPRFDANVSSSFGSTVDCGNFQWGVGLKKVDELKGLLVVVVYD
jgi:hypothetical protein